MMGEYATLDFDLLNRNTRTAFGDKTLSREPCACVMTTTTDVQIDVQWMLGYRLPVVFKRDGWDTGALKMAPNYGSINDYCVKIHEWYIQPHTLMATSSFQAGFPRDAMLLFAMKGDNLSVSLYSPTQEVPEMAEETLEKIKEYLELLSLKKEVQENLKNIKEKMAPIEEEVVSNMLDHGMQNIKVDGHTVSIRRSFYASMPSEGGVQALNAMGLDSMLMVSGAKLSAYLREYLDAKSEQADAQGKIFDPDKALDEFLEANPQFKGLLKSGNKISLQTRKG